MKVLLISANTTNAPHPVYPLGLDYVAGALTPRHEVRILDMNLAQGPAGLEAAIRESAWGLIGISIRNIDNVDALAVKSFIPGYERIVRVVRGCSAAPIVLGGSGFSIFPGELMARLGADFGVVGAGEAIGPLADALAAGTDPAGLAGIVLKGRPPGGTAAWPGGVTRQTCPDEAQLRYYLGRGGILNLQTKRGCPFRCIYCTYPHIEGREFRFFPPDAVAREARRLQELGARYLFLTDSAFNGDEEHALAVARAFRSEEVKVPWGAFFAPLRPPAGFYDRMAEAGLTHVEFGTETLCDPQLRRYGKPFTNADVFTAHEQARRAGLYIAHYLLLGGPGEDPQTVAETLERTERLEKAVFFAFCGIRIFPHAPLYALALEEGQITAGQDLLEPVFYRSRGIGTAEILARVQGQAAGRVNWVTSDGGDQTERIVTKMHSRGRPGPLWELLLR
ncbi:MAG: lipid biosynthesis B12-binding/radical SAM protein [Syntrophales bacterium]